MVTDLPVADQRSQHRPRGLRPGPRRRRRRGHARPRRATSTTGSPATARTSPRCSTPAWRTWRGFFNAAAVPWNCDIDPRTMEIIDSSVGWSGDVASRRSQPGLSGTAGHAELPAPGKRHLQLSRFPFMKSHLARRPLPSCSARAAADSPARSRRPRGAARRSAAGTLAPDFTGRDITGNTFRLSDHLGKDVVLLDFWSTYCEPCKAEFPHLQRDVRRAAREGAARRRRGHGRAGDGGRRPFVREEVRARLPGGDRRGLAHRLALQPEEVDAAQRPHRQGRAASWPSARGTTPATRSWSPPTSTRRSRPPARPVTARAPLLRRRERLLRVRPRVAPSPLPRARVRGRRGSVDSKPVQLDVTETTIVAQHFDPRTRRQGQAVPGPVTIEDSGWGEWINRLNAALRWDRWTAGLRLDSAVYWRRPADNAGYTIAVPDRTTAIIAAGQRVALPELDLPRQALDDLRGARARGHGGRLVRAVRARADALHAQGGRARDRHHGARREGADSSGTRSPSPPSPASPTRRAWTRPRGARSWSRATSRRDRRPRSRSSAATASWGSTCRPGAGSR